jgi:hypothetical protein
MMFRPRKLQTGGEYEEDNKFNPTPINLRPQPSYGFVGPMQPTTPNYGPMGPFNYDNSPGLKDDCPEGMTWSEEDQRCVYPNGYDPTQEQEKNKPKGRGIDGMGTPKTGPGTGVNPQDPVKKQQSKIDPYFALRGATTGLSWLSEMVDRNRQNQYATDQYSTLGQIDPMPVSNFQPNRYNLYAQKGGKLSPITVDNPNDPRLRAYNDSLNLYNQYQYNNKELENLGFYAKDKEQIDKGKDYKKRWNNLFKGENFIQKETQKLPDTDIKLKRRIIGNIAPEASDVWRSDAVAALTNQVYKKPVQPVVYQKPKPSERKPIITNDPKDPRLRAYNDSLNIYKSTSADIKALQKIRDSYPKGSTEALDEWMNYTNEWYKKPDAKASSKSYFNLQKLNGKYPSPVKSDYLYNSDGSKDLDNQAREFKKPVQPVIYQKEQKDYPIVTRPGAQVRGNITPGQMTRDTTQDGVPIYGPANSTIGYYNNGQFSPYTGVNQRGTVNNPDTELMQNSEALKKYLRGKGLNFKKGGLTPNKARQILHDGTVHGEPITEKQRRFFGAKSKGHTNFRK